MNNKMRRYGTVFKRYYIFICNEYSSINPIQKVVYSELNYCNAKLNARHVANTAQSNKKDPRKDFQRAYNPKDVENDWYNWWEEKGYFLPNPSATGEVFSMVLPPPNVTGTLHLGHALTCTIQDVLARWHRMQGHQVMWVPGMDHAGIATQVMVERKLWHEQKLTRHDIGRDEFEREIWRWKEEKANHITEQLRRLGLTLDWTREMFTMDPVQSGAVTEAFVRLFDSGLIYRADSLVNWSCALQSAISDIEVDWKQITGITEIEVPGYTELVEFGVLTDFAYRVCDKDAEIVISTTRVETMVGDTAVAVHPGDERYKHLHGEYVWHPFRNVRLPVICDDFVNPELGTGAVKITPAHDHTDFEVGKRHNLHIISVINEKGKLNEKCGVFSNMKRYDARKCITEKLADLGLLRGKHSHTMQVPFCSRSDDVVELLMKPQWFVNCQNMAQKALTAVEKGDLRIDPVDFEKTWYSWLHDIRDWCISRQLWWGHQIPAYECWSHSKPESSVWVAARNSDEARHKAATRLNVQMSDISRVNRDADVLDTWFSSALFPFSAFGWPSKPEKFYPLTLMETGHDILFFWVARMVMLGTELTGRLPFKPATHAWFGTLLLYYHSTFTDTYVTYTFPTCRAREGYSTKLPIDFTLRFKNILLHGIICDAHGRKMSKSLGNVIYPEDIITGITLEELHLQARNNYEAGLLSRSELEKAVDGQKKLFPKGIAACGADALRFTLCTINVKNHYNSFDVQQCQANSLFCNKIWQATKYILMCLQKVPVALCSDLESSQGDFSKLDRWILSRLAVMVADVHRGLSAADLHVATSALKTFIYSELCDVYIETTKPVLKQPDTKMAVAACKTLLYCMDTALHALSPFMPFVSEELYQHLPRPEKHHCSESIVVAPYPKPHEWEHWRDIQLEYEISRVMNTISSIRRLKAIHNISKNEAEVHIVTPEATERDMYMEYEEVMKVLAGCKNIVIVAMESPGLKNNSDFEMVGPSTSLHLITESTVIMSQEGAQVDKKEEKLLKELAKINKMTASTGYKNKAPLHVQEAHKLKIQNLENELRRIKEFRKSPREVNSGS